MRCRAFDRDAVPRLSARAIGDVDTAARLGYVAITDLLDCSAVGGCHEKLCADLWAVARSSRANSRVPARAERCDYAVARVDSNPCSRVLGCKRMDDHRKYLCAQLCAGVSVDSNSVCRFDNIAWMSRRPVRDAHLPTRRAANKFLPGSDRPRGVVAVDQYHTEYTMQHCEQLRTCVRGGACRRFADPRMPTRSVRFDRSSRHLVSCTGSDVLDRNLDPGLQQLRPHVRRGARCGFADGQLHSADDRQLDANAWLEFSRLSELLGCAALGTS